MAKTFEDISKTSSATHYHFLFAQRTLALQHEPPTPPPLNVLGLLCEGICRLWARLNPGKFAAYNAATGSLYHKYLYIHLKGATAAQRRCMEAAAEAEACRDSGEGRGSGEGRVSSNGEGGGARRGRGQGQRAFKAVAEAEAVAAAGLMALATRITEYIIDHQDDAARLAWRKIMERDMKEVHAKMDHMKRDMNESFKKVDTDMQQRFKDVHAKMDETIQLVNDLADLVKQP
eukprot:scaffold113672_cov68-Phaeocystis_antarctica.AAC.3